MSDDKTTDALSVFESPKSEADGVWVDIEHPKTGEVLMRWKIARFGGRNNPVIVREERKLKGKLPPGARRQIDAGGGDPAVVQRLNRQVFVRVSCIDWELIDPSLQHLGSFSPEKADELLERADRMYDLLSDKAVDEETFATDQMRDDLGNSPPSSSGNSPTAEGSTAS